MSENEPDVHFEDALEMIFRDERVPIHLLYQLSDMSPDQKALFDQEWRAIDTERRREIARHLVDLSELNYVVDFQPIFVACLDDANPYIQIAGLDGLWDSTDVRLVPQIIHLLQDDPVAEVRAAAAGALAHYLLMSAWGELRGVPTEQIAAALLKAYQEPGAELVVRRVALEALGAINSPEISRLIEEAYEGAEHEMRLSALFAMGNSADALWLPTVLDELQSPHDDMRVEAARAAGNIGGSEAIIPLAELAYDENQEVAEAAIAALGEIGGDQVESILMEMSEDIELDHLQDFVLDTLEESEWQFSDLQFGLFSEDLFDEEE